MQHFQGVPSRCARMIRCTIASPIRFSIFTSLTTVLHQGQDLSEKACSEDLRRNEELVFDVHEMLRQLNGCRLIRQERMTAFQDQRWAYL